MNRILMAWRGSAANVSYAWHPRQSGVAGWPALKGVVNRAFASSTPSAVANQIFVVNHQIQ